MSNSIIQNQLVENLPQSNRTKTGDNNQDKPAKPLKVECYLKTQGGIFSVPTKSCPNFGSDKDFKDFSLFNEKLGSTIPFVNEVAGAKLQYKAAFIEAEVGAGTAYSASVKAGADIPLGEIASLEISGDARAAQSIKENSVTFDTYQYKAFDVIPVKGELEEPITVNYKPSNKTAGLNLVLHLHGENFQIYGGVRGSINSSNTPYLEPTKVPFGGGNGDDPTVIESGKDNPAAKGDPDITVNVNQAFEQEIYCLDYKHPKLASNSLTKIGGVWGISFSPIKNLEIGLNGSGRDMFGNITWYLHK